LSMFQLRDYRKLLAVLLVVLSNAE
jgi:hypothetical protein